MWHNAALIVKRLIVATIFLVDGLTLPISPSYSPLMHRLALVTVAATLLLIFMGGLVTSNGAGMSVPDWPNSFGYNMFTFPVSKWVGGIFYEHTHRLMATVVGFCSLLLCLHAWGLGRSVGWRHALLIIGAVCVGMTGGFGAAAMAVHPGQANLPQLLAVGFAMLSFCCFYGCFCRRPHPSATVRWLATAVLFGVIFQGLLGGYRVVLIKLGLAIIHACVAQAFLCLIAALAVVTSRWWVVRRGQASPNPLRWWLALCVAVVYGQLIVGALMRHHQAGLAIPDLPLAYGHLLPPMNQAQLDQANALRLLDPRYQVLGSPPVTLFQIWLHFAHRCGAILVTIVLGSAIVAVLRRVRDKALRTPTMILAGLLLTQLTLGVLTVEWQKPADVASLHVVTGAAVLMTCFVMYLRSYRIGLNAQSRRSAFEVLPKEAALSLQS